MVLLCSATVCANCLSSSSEAALPVTCGVIVCLFFESLPIRRGKDTKNYRKSEFFSFLFGYSKQPRPCCFQIHAYFDGCHQCGQHDNKGSQIGKKYVENGSPPLEARQLLQWYDGQENGKIASCVKATKKREYSEISLAILCNFCCLPQEDFSTENV